MRGYFPMNKLAAARAASKTAPAAHKTLVLAVGETIERLIELVDDGCGLAGRALLRCRTDASQTEPRMPLGTGLSQASASPGIWTT